MILACTSSPKNHYPKQGGLIIFGRFNVAPVSQREFNLVKNQKSRRIQFTFARFATKCTNTKWWRQLYELKNDKYFLNGRNKPLYCSHVFFKRYICIRVCTLNIAKKKATLFSAIYVNRRKEDDIFIPTTEKVQPWYFVFLFLKSQSLAIIRLGNLARFHSIQPIF